MTLVVASPRNTTHSTTGKPDAGEAVTSVHLPGSMGVPFPSHVQLTGATGRYADDVNGGYALQPSCEGNLDKKWQFCYSKTDSKTSEGVKRIMCYGEGLPELGSTETAKGLAGWVVGLLNDGSEGGSLFVVARWEIRDKNGKFNSIETMDARLVMASSSTIPTAAAAVDSAGSPTAVQDATALIKKQLHIGSPRKPEEEAPTKQQQKIALTNLLAHAQAQMEAATTSSGGILTHQPSNSESSDKSSKHSSKGKSRHPTTPLSANAPAFVPRHSSLSATAPPFVPHQKQQQKSAQSPIQSKSFGSNTSSIEQLFRNAHLQQGVRVNAQLRKVSWNLGAVRDQLKTIAPGEGLVSATFRLPLDDFTPGPPMKFKFFPFGISGKSAPGCVAFELDCPQGARMKFRISIGDLSSGTKVLMGNAFYVDFDAAKLNTDKGDASQDSGVVQAIKFDELVVSLELLDWLQ